MTHYDPLHALNIALTLYGEGADNRIVTDLDSGGVWRWEVFDPRTGEWVPEYKGKLTECADLQDKYNNPPPPPF